MYALRMTAVHRELTVRESATASTVTIPFSLTKVQCSARMWAPESLMVEDPGMSTLPTLLLPGLSWYT